jgi:ATP-binding cassette subfamily B protein
MTCTAGPNWKGSSVENETAGVEGSVPFDIDAVAHPNIDRKLRYLPRVVASSVRMVRQAAPGLFVGTVVLQAAASAAVAAEILIIRSLLTQLLRDQTSGDFRSVVPSVVAMAIILAFVSVAGIARVEFQRLLSELVSRYCMRRVISTSAAVDLVAFDHPDFHDRLQRATVNATMRPFQMTSGLLALGGSLLGTASVGVVLLLVQPLFFVLILAAVIPLSLTSVRIGRALYEFEVEQTPISRQRYYLQALLVEKDPAKELRAYSLAGYLSGWFDLLYDARIRGLRKLIRYRLRAGIAAGLLTATITGGVLGLLIWFVADGRASLASAGSAAVALLLLGSQLQSLASGVGQLYESSLFVQDFNDFVALARPDKPVRGTEILPSRLETIAATDLSFCYPSRSGAALQHVDIEIAPGEVVALVGENGSGKTTLAKLLAGLYQPESGRITWGGVDMAAVDPDQLHDRIAILFQDFLRYYLSARHNITLGRSGRVDDLDGMVLAAHRAGADGFLLNLPNGYETSLSPQFFGGSDLSGGQWQRLALARAFFRDAQLVILDEPTASLDPRAEADLFATVRDLFAGRSVVLISHRFASVRLADRIYVLDAGQIIEHGTHEELIDAQGRYAELYALQASAFGLHPSTTRDSAGQ